MRTPVLAGMLLATVAATPALASSPTPPPTGSATACTTTASSRHPLHQPGGAGLPDLALRTGVTGLCRERPEPAEAAPSRDSGTNYAVGGNESIQTLLSVNAARPTNFALDRPGSGLDPSFNSLFYSLRLSGQSLARNAIYILDGGGNDIGNFKVTDDASRSGGGHQYGRRRQCPEGTRREIRGHHQRAGFPAWRRPASPSVNLPRPWQAR